MDISAFDDSTTESWRVSRCCLHVMEYASHLRPFWSLVLLRIYYVSLLLGNDVQRFRKQELV